jgi:methylase of polypeptide subunit release factors
MNEYIESRGLRIFTDSHVYQPREDSFLMSDILIEEKIAQGDLVEIGSGTGIIILSLAKSNPNSSYYAVEINYEAALLTKKNSIVNEFDNIQIICSNNLRPFRKNSLPKILVFNPPYLPVDPEIDPHTPKYELYQLVGGDKGYETLNDTISILSILDYPVTLYCIISSLSINPIEFANLHEEWNTSVLTSQNMGFEVIWVLKMRRSN